MRHDSSASKALIDHVSRSLFSGQVRNSSVFISTGVTYPNGTAVAVRIDEGQHGYVVSDDGYATMIAEGMVALPALSRIAPGVAQRAGILFESGTFFVAEVARNSLPSVVSVVANASARAVERVVVALEQPRIKRSRDLFNNRLRAAYGDKVIFDLELRGATGKNWEFNAGVKGGGEVMRLFELVSPSTQAVAIAHLKIADTQSLPSPPLVTAALADYEHTDPALRGMLSDAGGVVISATDDVSKYQLSAA